MPATEPPGAEWTIRIDEHPGLKGALDKWTGDHVVVLAVWEAADDDSPNPHVHMAVRFPLEITRQTLRNRIAPLLPPGHKRSDFATARWDGDDKLLAYLCKGPSWASIRKGTHHGDPLPPVVWTSTMLGMTVSSLHTRFWTENKAKAPPPKAKKSKQSGYRELSQQIADQILKEKAIDVTNKNEWVVEASRLLLLETKGYIADHTSFMIIQMVLYLGMRETTEKSHADRMLKKFSAW